MKDLINKTIDLLETMADDYEEYLPAFPNRMTHARELANELREEIRAKSKWYSVDLPNPHDLESPFINIGTFNNKADAIKAIRQFFVCDDDGNVNIISEIDN